MIDMGAHLILDFVDVETFDLGSYEQIHKFTLEALRKIGCTIVGHQ